MSGRTRRGTAYLRNDGSPGKAAGSRQVAADEEWEGDEGPHMTLSAGMGGAESNSDACWVVFGSEFGLNRGLKGAAPTFKPLSSAFYGVKKGMAAWDICAHLLRAMASCTCLLYTSPSPRDRQKSRMPSSA